MSGTISRRSLLEYAAAVPAGLGAIRGEARDGAKQVAAGDGKMLFVIAAAGGASIMDAFLPALRQPGTPATLNAYDLEELERGPGDLRCVKNISYQVGVPVGPRYEMIDFLRRHGSDTAVLTVQGSSVNHLVAAERSLNGNGANSTRTIMEAVADRYGRDMLLPNVNMATGGYASEGRDPTLQAYARAASIGDAQLFPFATHASKGVAGAPASDLISRARLVRGQLEPLSPFTSRFRTAAALQRYLSFRAGIGALEAQDLIRKLMLIDEARQGIPLSRYGLAASDDLGVLQDAFAGVGSDTFHAQAALSFLLAKYGISCALTIGMSDAVQFDGDAATRIENLPLAFDWSHNHHRGAQNSMWRRVLQVADNLIQLLKNADYLGDPANGKMWNRSLIYIATEFGRTKDTQQAGSRGSAHDQNNGNLVISPLVRGGRVYGGIDAMTGATYGFDPVTGEPALDRVMDERAIYSAISGAMGIDFSGRIAMPALWRTA